MNATIATTTNQHIKIFGGVTGTDIYFLFALLYTSLVDTIATNAITVMLITLG